MKNHETVDMNRRGFLKVSGFGLAVMAVRMNSGAAAAVTPNLVIIHTDEHNLRTLGCYRETMSAELGLMWGAQTSDTPNIDNLAHNGALCTRYHATSPVCTPSRAAFVSGRYPQNTVAESNDTPMDGSIITFGEVLRLQGYATGYAGKWHLDGTGKPQWAPSRQFGFTDNRFMFNRGHWKKMEDTPEGPRVAARNASDAPTYDVDGADDTSFTTDWLCDKLIDFIVAHKSEPFCYMVSLPDPHGPNTVRVPYDTMYDSSLVEIPPTFYKTAEQTPAWAGKDGSLTETNIRNIMPLYFGMVKCIDDNVGKVMTALADNGVLDNTIVVFTADHGDLCGEHARLNKGNPLDMSARIPLVVYYPTKIAAGTIIDKALGCVDFLPTIINLMGFDTLGTEDGRDASGFFTGTPVTDWTDVAFIRGSSNHVSAVTARYKLVYSTTGDAWLYDVEKDPNELVNYFADTSYRTVLYNLTVELVEYCTTFNESKYDNATIRADIDGVLAAGPLESTPSFKVPWWK
jgi:arylsulfatase A-like enzyme